MKQYFMNWILFLLPFFMSCDSLEVKSRPDVLKGDSFVHASQKQHDLEINFTFISSRCTECAKHKMDYKDAYSTIIFSAKRGILFAYMIDFKSQTLRMPYNPIGDPLLSIEDTSLWSACHGTDTLGQSKIRSKHVTWYSSGVQVLMEGESIKDEELGLGEHKYRSTHHIYIDGDSLAHEIHEEYAPFQSETIDIRDSDDLLRVVYFPLPDPDFMKIYFRGEEIALLMNDGIPPR